MEVFLSAEGKREVLQEVFYAFERRKIECSGTVQLLGLLVANPLLEILYITTTCLRLFFCIFFCRNEVNVGSSSSVRVCVYLSAYSPDVMCMKVKMSCTYVRRNISFFFFLPPARSTEA